MSQRPHTGFDVSQAFPVRQLRKSHDQELFVTGQSSDVIVASILLHAFVELVLWQPIHQLGKNRASFVHLLALLPYGRRKPRQNAFWN
jgi:hypothetical protein